MADKVLVNTEQLVSTAEAEELLHAGALFLDVRPSSSGHDPHAGRHHNHDHPPNPTGTIESSVIVDRRDLEELLQPASELSKLLAENPAREVVVYCNSPFGSDPVVGALVERGVRAKHIDGGFRAWVADGRPTVETAEAK
ncbi:rhodanese-like domain-containing protein [Agromyces intestinalis]|uniref:Rhodanese-like domain-containing protein n=1 Tax=Agromyces intestinalis TaxID=2592652 RepID=A0A5C1YFU3_9MICO|nr:rhodanese-like domain-containing protein [Agromyces intestinalis]QEO14395.1 rhodanese-like domain-containing protein [Agromyces intestinalis]